MPAKNIFINTKAPDPASALVVSATNMTPVSFSSVFVMGDNKEFNLYLVDSDTLTYDTRSGAVGYTVKMAIGAPGASPSGGTYTITAGAVTTTALAYNATSTVIQAALNALNTNTGPFGDLVTVRGTFPTFEVIWTTAAARALMTTTSTSLTPQSSVVIAETQTGDGSTIEKQAIYLARTPAAIQGTWTPITNGWNAILDTNTIQFRELLGEETSTSSTLEVQITDASAQPTTMLQIPVTLRSQTIDEATLIAAILSSFYTATETLNAFVQNRSALVGLTGGGATKLDGVTTAAGAASAGNLVAIYHVSAGAFLLYKLTSGTTAESAPWTIRPDDYAGTTNELIWKLINISKDGAPCLWNTTDSLFHPIVADKDSTTGLIGVGTDQTGFSITS